MKTSADEILAFIDAAKRFPESPQKTLWVGWLVKQYEARISGGKFTMRINISNGKQENRQSKRSKTTLLEVRSRS